MATRPRLILVVEDEGSLRELIANILLLDHHEVDTVRDGAEALYRIEQRAYDLIISDLQMPNLDGPGLYTALRKRFGEALPRVIFVTGHAEADKFVPFLAETGDPVLTKPFSVEDLRTLVQWVLET
jgi:CheY-like chemotaxis protein